MTSTKDSGCVEKPASRIRTVCSKLARPFVSVWAAYQIRKAKPNFPTTIPLIEGAQTDGSSNHREQVATTRGPYVGAGSKSVDNFRAVNVYEPPVSPFQSLMFSSSEEPLMASHGSAGFSDYFGNLKIVILPPRDHLDQPVSMSAPNDNYQMESMDAKFLSCKYHGGIAEFELFGRNPIGIRMSSETVFTVKEHFSQSIVTTQTVVTANAERVCKEISKCAGQKIIMIAVTYVDGKTQLSIFFDGGDALAVTSEKPMAICTVPDC